MNPALDPVSQGLLSHPSILKDGVASPAVLPKATRMAEMRGSIESMLA
jgi:hypothetical protein